MDEAIDLVLKLPQGSLWRGSRWPELSWDAYRHDMADIKDLLAWLLWRHGAYGDPSEAELPRTRRPMSREQQEAERRRAEAEAERRAERARVPVRQVLESTHWEEA